MTKGRSQHAGAHRYLRRADSRITALAAALAIFALLAIAASAQAGPPHHRFLSAFDGSDTPAGDFDKACGSAVDSEGNSYVASAGNGAIDVFDLDRQYLATIANANGPCGLAVGEDGDLYVAEQTTGNVVKYAPDVYPLTGSPSWGAASAVDSSGQARGLGLDPADGRLYVARGTHVVTYGADGVMGANEVQRLALAFASGGRFTVTFGGYTTDAIDYDASAAVVEAELKALGSIGPDGVSVTIGQGTPGVPDQWAYDVTFTGPLGSTDVAQLVPDSSNLVGSGFPPNAFVTTLEQGFDGVIGMGDLGDATGVGAYTYGYGRSEGVAERYLSVADAATNRVEVFTGENFMALAPSHTMDGSSTPTGSMSFGGSGASIGIDQANGHVLVYDDGHSVVNEFEATGAYVTQIDRPELEDANPTGIAIDRSGTANDGQVHVTAGAGPGAQVLVFGPFSPASRPRLPQLDKNMTTHAVDVDSQGNVYVVQSAQIQVFAPDGTLRGTLDTDFNPSDVDVDSAGNLYVLENGLDAPLSGDEAVSVYAPAVSFPFAGDVSYGDRQLVAEIGHGSLSAGPTGMGVDPITDELYVGDNNGKMVKYASAAGGSGIVDGNWWSAGGQVADVDGHAATGEIYVAVNQGQGVNILEPDGTPRHRITGISTPDGAMNQLAGIAVDQSSGHFVVSRVAAIGAMQEFEPSGAFLAQTGAYPASSGAGSGVAIDNSGGPHDGTLYFAYQNALSAYGPLSYGEVPAVVTGNVSGVGDGGATLEGTVEPRGFVTASCAFEYTDEEDFQANGFASAVSVPCAETAAEIGSGTDPVSVHADASGLAEGGSYRFRLVVSNEFGSAEGDGVLFGPPVATTRPASEVHYTEAILNAAVDPAAQATTWRFEYGTDGPCDANPCASTANRELPAGSGAVEVDQEALELSPDRTYHFRVVAENASGTVPGADLTFRTLRRVALDCPNASLRTGPSADLPDCRAYELVTPADMGGRTPKSLDGAFNQWMVTPTGPRAGESLMFATNGTVPGLEGGNGILDGIRARRTAEGWRNEIFGPSAADIGDGGLNPMGVEPNHEYALWEADTSRLLTPTGWALIAEGALGSDPTLPGFGEPDAPEFLSAGGEHVVFKTGVRLEEAAPPAGTVTVYDRPVGGTTQVVSLLPGDVTPPAGQDASFEGISADGSAIAFNVGGSLYVRRDHSETVLVAGAPNSFAGLSTSGDRVFYTTGTNVTGQPDGEFAGDLVAFDLDSETATAIASDAWFVNVAEDGSRVYFVSEQQLDPPHGAAGAPNLYVWDGAGASFVAVLDGEDLVSFLGRTEVDMTKWTSAIDQGRVLIPTRSTVDGGVLLFQSQADLTGQNSDGFSQVYRYDSADESLLCVSCDRGGEPAGGDAAVQRFIPNSPVGGTVLIPNLTADGRVAFFESEERLAPEDNNAAVDVYKWSADGADGCTRPGGCLDLISAGRGAADSYLYSMTPDGHDVFFLTDERLVAEDQPDTLSIYDARVGGGFAEAYEPAVGVCEGACQRDVSPPPPEPSIATALLDVPGARERRARIRVVPMAVRGSVLRLRVRVSHAGVIVVAGRQVRNARRRVRRPGAYTLRVRLTRPARRQLASRRGVRVVMRVGLARGGGRATTVRVALTVRRPHERKRKR